MKKLALTFIFFASVWCIPLSFGEPKQVRRAVEPVMKYEMVLIGGRSFVEYQKGKNFIIKKLATDKEAIELKAGQILAEGDVIIVGKSSVVVLNDSGKQIPLLPLESAWYMIEIKGTES